MNTMLRITFTILTLASLSPFATAAETSVQNNSTVETPAKDTTATSTSVTTAKTDNKKDDDVQDMSDPLAVYTQVGAGYSNKGLNIKIGRTYDTGKKNVVGMNLLEIKGIMGDDLGWAKSSQKDNSIDSFRLRNFVVNQATGRNFQLDINYNVDGVPGVAKQTADVSYSILQRLPQWGPIQFFPLAGLGASVGEDAIEHDGDIDGCFSMMGVYGIVGMYSQLNITKKLWLNYNPMWMTTIAGDKNYEDNYYGEGNSHMYMNEFAVNYQITPRFNVRYYVNWNHDVNFIDGDQRIEFNYQI